MVNVLHVVDHDWRVVDNVYLAAAAVIVVAATATTGSAALLQVRKKLIMKIKKSKSKQYLSTQSSLAVWADFIDITL
ncbi:unnamed protein product, partial [Brenthis ino]